MDNSILIVDDESLNLKVLKTILENEYEIIVAKSGEQALKRIEAYPPSLILLDILMPEMDGYEVCRRLKENQATANIPIIFITALTEALDEAKGFTLGAVDYITKPFSPVVVEARIRTHMSLKKKTDILESLALLDGLTNIFNRRKFDEVLEDEWKRALRSSSFLSLALMDIDQFKSFNDYYGHAWGDECLKTVAKVLQKTVRRPSDLVARYGGEEFVTLLPMTGYEGAMRIGEDLRLAVESEAIPHEKSSIAPCITISSGVATIMPGHSPTSALTLLKEADRMLYKSKNNGRNSVHGILLES